MNDTGGSVPAFTTQVETPRSGSEVSGSPMPYAA